MKHPRSVKTLLSTLLALVSVASFSARPAQAQPQQDPKTLLEKVGVTLKGLKQYEVTVKTSLEQITRTGEKRVETKAYKITIQRPDKFRMEMNDDNTLFGTSVRTGGPVGLMFIVGRENSVWLYAPEFKKYGRLTSKVSKEAAELVGNPSNWLAFFEQILFSVPRDENQASQGRLLADEHLSQDGKDIDCYVVQFDSRRSTLWIDKTTYLVVRQFDQDSTTSMTTDFVFGRIDVPLSSDLFIVSPAPDAKEEDLNFTENPFH